MADKRYGQVEFSKLTGIVRSTLHKLHQSGKCKRHDSKYQYDYYLHEDFYNPEISSRMNKKGLSVPAVNPTLKPVPVNKKAKVLPFTSDKVLYSIPSGKLKTYVKPLAGMTEEARAIWEFTLPDLIDLGSINKSDLHILMNYCMAQASITEMGIVLARDGIMLDEVKVNPLIAMIDRTRSTVKALALTLCITNIGRKGLKAEVEPDADTQAWDKLLQG